MKIKKFINTYNETEFVNIDFIVSIRTGSYGYYVKTCDGNEHLINDLDEGKILFTYLKSLEIEIPNQNK